MAEEKEIKLQLHIPLATFIKRITRKGFKKNKTVQQCDHYFDTKSWKLYHHVSTVRARVVDNHEDTFTFKKVFHLPKRKRSWYIEELETTFPLGNKQILDKIFSKISIPYQQETFTSLSELSQFMISHSMYPEQKMKKSRTIYKRDDNEIVVDDVEHVGIIIELECKSCNPFAIASTLLEPFEWERFFQGTSFLWLEKVKGLTAHKRRDKKFKKQPDWNVWEHERNFYRSINQKHT